MSCAALLTAGVLRSSALKGDTRAEEKRQFQARVRDGVGKEVAIAARGSSQGEVRSAVNSVANFMERRSGLSLSGRTKVRLAEMEARVSTGAGRGLTLSEVGDIITATALERVSALSDREIAYVDETLRGFNAPGMPKRYDRNFSLPGGVVFIGTAREKTVARLQAVRDQSGGPAGDVLKGLLGRVVKERVKDRARYLSESVPEKFGNMWDVINDGERGVSNGGVTPLQAVLIIYSLASDDYLSDGDEALDKRMKIHQSALTRATGEDYPSPSGHRPFGVNGYIFSSPLDLVLDEQTVNRLLDRLEERFESDRGTR
ncbi:MAG: hypothetical protein ABW250_20550 [Pyrinomonadaceae bacterium]